MACYFDWKIVVVCHVCILSISTYWGTILLNDQRSFRALIAKSLNCLSSNERRRLLFSLYEIEQNRFSDNLAIDKILNLFKSLFGQDKINNHDFNNFIEAFREIGFDDVVKRISGRWRNQFNTRFFRLFSISIKETASKTVGIIKWLDDQESKVALATWRWSGA